MEPIRNSSDVFYKSKEKYYTFYRNPKAGDTFKRRESTPEKQKQSLSLSKTSYQSISYKPIEQKPLSPNPEEIKKIKEIASILTQTCLLYTSPSPRDRQKSRMPSSA